MVVDYGTDIFKEYVKGAFANTNICLKLTQKGSFTNPVLVVYNTKDAFSFEKKDFDGNDFTCYGVNFTLRKEQLVEMRNHFNKMIDQLG